MRESPDCRSPEGGISVICPKSIFVLQAYSRSHIYKYKCHQKSLKVAETFLEILDIKRQNPSHLTQENLANID